MSTICQIAIWVFMVMAASFTSAFIILFATVSGVREKLAIYAPRILSKMVSCDFCFSFWINLLVALFIASLFWDFTFLYLCILTTPITRLLIS